MFSFLNGIRQKTLLSLASSLQFGSLDLTLPDGSTHHFTGPEPGPHADLHLRSYAALSRMMTSGKLGFCEAYMDGLIHSDRLSDLIELTVMHNQYVERTLKANPLSSAFQKFNHWRNANSKTGSKRNIAYHYDLGNDFYKTWLDPSMTYSSAVFSSSEESLQSAQTRKYERLCELADIQPGDRVLEIGCGWGGFAEHAARHRGAHVTGITISAEQFSYATERLKNAGLDGVTDIQMRDYRDIDETYDKIVSIEMFEAVGQKYWPVYFGKVASTLKSGGRAALQIITIDHSEFEDYRLNPDFIQRYIFPGGMLPSIELLKDCFLQSGLRLQEAQGYGKDYAETLKRWRHTFTSAWEDELQQKGFDDRFKRMWELYLAYCEGGFNAGLIDVKQIALQAK